MKKIIFIICIIANLCCYSYAYTDIDSAHWAYSSVNKLTEQGILSGYPDGKFNPNDKMTIAEFLAVLIKIMAYKADVSTDSPHWAQGYIDYAIENKIVNMDDYVAFNPDEYITRLEICKMIINSFESTKNAYVSTLGTTFLDISSQNYEEQRIAKILKEIGILSGYPDGTVGFDKMSTRAEISCFMNLVKEKINKLKYYRSDVTYEDNIAKFNVRDKDILLRKYEFASDNEYCDTIITNIQMFEFDRANETKYKETFSKLFNSEHPYAKYRQNFGEGNYVIAIDLKTINNTEKYKVLTGYQFVNLFFQEEDIYIIDSFDIDEIIEQLGSNIYIGTNVSPAEIKDTSAFYVLNKLPREKFLISRPLTTLYDANTLEQIDVSSFHSAIIYIKEE